MSDAKKCDKCQSYMNLTSQRVEITLEYHYQGQRDLGKVDLCLQCQGKLQEFMRKREE